MEIDVAANEGKGQASQPRMLGDWHAVIVDPRKVDDVLGAREALRLLGTLPDRQWADLSLLVAACSYEEIGRLTGTKGLRPLIRRARERLYGPEFENAAETPPIGPRTRMRRSRTSCRTGVKKPESPALKTRQSCSHPFPPGVVFRPG
jgi:hypothetical protein